MSELVIEAPGSKSMTQRALVIAALADQPTRVERPLDCDDSRHLTGLLEAMGVELHWKDDRIEVEPRPLKAPAAAVFCGNAGTTVRFGAALSALCEGPLRLDGNVHMRRRPMGPLTSALAALGVEVDFEGEPGRLPVRLSRQSEPAGEARVDASLSSQFGSGLMLVAPRLPRGLVVRFAGDVVSEPYLEMTATMMRRAGAEIERLEDGYRVLPGGYRGGAIAVEPDWSGAAFLLGAARIAGVPVTVPGLEGSIQGDSAFAEMLAAFDREPSDGVHAFDLTDTPDLIAPLTAVALFASRPTVIRGAAHTRVKESDRVAVLAGELQKLGATIEARSDGLDIEPLVEARSAALDPHGDHRMAMAFGLVGLRVPLEVTDRACVTKSFPRFWEALAQIAHRRIA